MTESVGAARETCMAAGREVVHEAGSYPFFSRAATRRSRTDPFSGCPARRLAQPHRTAYKALKKSLCKLCGPSRLLRFHGDS